MGLDYGGVFGPSFSGRNGFALEIPAPPETAIFIPAFHRNAMKMP